MKPSNHTPSLHRSTNFPWLSSTENSELNHSQSKSYVTTDGLSASLSWNKAPLWGLRPDIYYCLTDTVLFFVEVNLDPTHRSVVEELCEALPCSRQLALGMAPVGPTQCETRWKAVLASFDNTASLLGKGLPISPCFCLARTA
jgi:hypothetical protein